MSAACVPQNTHSAGSQSVFKSTSKFRRISDYTAAYRHSLAHGFEKGVVMGGQRGPPNLFCICRSTFGFGILPCPQYCSPREFSIQQARQGDCLKLLYLPLYFVVQLLRHQFHMLLLRQQLLLYEVLDLKERQRLPDGVCK